MMDMCKICERLIKLLIVLSITIVLFPACKSRKQDIGAKVMELSLERVPLHEDVSLRRILYIDDSLIVADAFSSEYKMLVLQKGLPSFGVLRFGNGPFEIMSARVKAISDTIHALAYSSLGITTAIRIPISSLRDLSHWESVDYRSLSGLRIGADFALWNSSEYVFPGAHYGDENMLSKIGMMSPVEVPLGFWPNDGYEGPAEPKLSVYLQTYVYSNGTKLLIASKEGKYASILDVSSGRTKEKLLYSEYPKYYADPDGLNWHRSPGCTTGCRAFATDSLVFLSHCTAMLEDGHFVPDNFKGYPPEYVDEIDVFDWDGNYQQTLHSPIPFLSFYIRGKELFLLTEDLETSLSIVYKCSI